jgi:hypothetical protein
MAFGQSNRFYGIIKTHPIAYIAKNFNLGFEIGKGESRNRLTLAAFWTNKMSTSPYPDSELGFHGDSGSNFDVKGLTYRFGYKHILKEKGNMFLYFEPQFRYALTSGIFNDVSNSITDVYDSKVRNTQILGLFGFQMPNEKKTFMIDFYVGLGYMRATINNVLKIAARSVAPPTRAWENKGMNVYMGTSIGIILGKN